MIREVRFDTKHDEAVICDILRERRLHSCGAALGVFASVFVALAVSFGAISGAVLPASQMSIVNTEKRLTQAEGEKTTLPPEIVYDAHTETKNVPVTLYNELVIAPQSETAQSGMSDGNGFVCQNPVCYESAIVNEKYRYYRYGDSVYCVDAHGEISVLKLENKNDVMYAYGDSVIYRYYYDSDCYDKNGLLKNTDTDKTPYVCYSPDEDSYTFLSENEFNDLFPYKWSFCGENYLFYVHDGVLYRRNDGTEQTAALYTNKMGIDLLRVEGRYLYFGAKIKDKEMYPYCYYDRAITVYRADLLTGTMNQIFDCTDGDCYCFGAENGDLLFRRVGMSTIFRVHPDGSYSEEMDKEFEKYYYGDYGDVANVSNNLKYSYSYHFFDEIGKFEIEFIDMNNNKLKADIPYEKADMFIKNGLIDGCFSGRLMVDDNLLFAGFQYFHSGDGNNLILYISEIKDGGVKGKLIGVNIPNKYRFVYVTRDSVNILTLNYDETPYSLRIPYNLDDDLATPDSANAEKSDWVLEEEISDSLSSDMDYGIDYK